MYQKLTKKQIKKMNAKILSMIMPNAKPKKKKLTLKQIFF